MLERNAGDNRTLASGNRDLGGATLDLSGTFLISAPVAIPTLHANFRITGGTLRASASFPPDRYMIEVGALGAAGWMKHGNCTTSDGGASCTEDGGLSELTLDGQYHAAGGIRVSTFMPRAAALRDPLYQQGNLGRVSTQA